MSDFQIPEESACCPEADDGLVECDITCKLEGEVKINMVEISPVKGQ